MESFAFRGFDIPIELMLKTGGGPDTFEVISDQHIRNLSSQHPITEGIRVLEIGCGIGRDAIPLAGLIGDSGSYVGTDIIRESIDWCTANITPKYPNVRFEWQDLSDSLHNPEGSKAAAELPLPAPDGSIDLVFAQSVFTHMLPAQFSHFLREARRVLAPGGTIYATCFRVDDAILASAGRPI